MKKIKEQGSEFYIFLKTPTREELIDSPLVVSNPHELELAEIYKGDDVKLTMIDLLNNGRGLLSWLYFRGGPESKVLDERILNDTYTDKDFEESAKTQYQITWCPNCGREYHTLTLIPDNLYPRNPTLYREKMNKFSPFFRARLVIQVSGY